MLSGVVKQMQHCNVYESILFSLRSFCSLVAVVFNYSFLFLDVWLFFSVAEMDQLLCLVFNVPALFLL